MTEKLNLQTKLFINNKFVDSTCGKETIPCINPATEKEFAKCQTASKDDVDKAVKSSRKAFQTWRNYGTFKRAALMNKFADLIEKNAERIAKIDSTNMGKPYMSSLYVDVPLSVQCIRYFAGWCEKIKGETISVEGDNFVYTLKEPVGVVGAIIPWNFPVLMAAWKLGPCLATGNTIIIKPSEKSPLSCLVLAELAEKAGFPPGVVTVLPGYGKTGSLLSNHMGIDKISFTGSVPTAKKIMTACAQSNLKRITLELGGKSPLIILDDADIATAVKIAEIGLFFNQGECCCAGSRVFVHEKIYDKFLKAAVESAKKIKVGDPNAKDSFYGAIADKLQFDRVMNYIKKGKDEKAKVMCGGKRIGDKGYFIEPTIFADLKEDMSIVKEEIFGPVMAVMKFKTIEEVIKKANNTIYGLAAGVVTNNISNALTLAHNIRAGTVWVNQYNSFHCNVPFGGYKQSGIGKDMGEQALNGYLITKAVHVTVPKYTKDIQKV